MKIAIPVMNSDGLKSVISEHFGHAEYFAFVDVENKEIKNIEIEANPFEEHDPGQIPSYVNDKGANVLIARGMGGRAKTFFAQFGIDTVTGASGVLGEIITAYVNGNLGSVDYEPTDKHLHHNN